MDKVTWTGHSGRKFDFELYTIDTVFNAVPACYIFARESAPRSWQAIYIGETSDLSTRFLTHHKMPCIQLYGATHICVYTNGMSNYISRYYLERDLVTNMKPPCNG